MAPFDERRRRANLAKHGIDLAECGSIFDAPMLTEVDDCEAYGEQRFRSLGWLKGRVVVLIWTDRRRGPHLISGRHGDKHETRLYFENCL